MVNTASTPMNYVIPHNVAPGSASEVAYQKYVTRNEIQNAIAQLSTTGGRNKKYKKSKKYQRSIRKRFSKKFRKSVMRRKVRTLNIRNKKNKKSLHGGAATLTIPSFPQSNGQGPTNTKDAATNHSRIVSYSEFDSQVRK